MPLTSSEIKDLASQFSSILGGRPDSDERRLKVIAQLHGDTPERTAYNIAAAMLYLHGEFYAGLFLHLLRREADYIDAGSPSLDQLLLDEEA